MPLSAKKTLPLFNRRETRALENIRFAFKSRPSSLVSMVYLCMGPKVARHGPTGVDEMTT